jgi:chemosensory pili system protein ChpC
VPSPNSRARVVVLNALNESLGGGAVAILSQGFPQLVRISPEFVKLDATREFADDSPVACQIQLLDDRPLVPDLDRLEAMIAQETEPLPGDSDSA